ncbi:MAG: tetratricopeptide repeat protein [Desulfobacteraceae bacterium]|nr:tetratricopeptide repeat protein [Desulfobacteraceae bacterium]MBC2749001.1 tetratricopeptide repeat protein [Desulfobacteraceae bacterium]
MDDPRLSVMNNTRPRTLLLILALLLAAYGNSFNASWHMDDYPNILNNPAIQMTEWNMASLSQAIGVDQAHGNNLSRPVANLSFALNWYLHGANVAGFHLINLIIHIFNTWLLYSFIVLLGATPGFPDRHRAHIHAIALGASLLWALNPIQTQAVTYIVQRMASLTTFFYMVALIAYLKLRLSLPVRWKIMWGIGVGIAFILALGTKGNAATVPLAIVLMEWLFFSEKSEPYINRRLGGVFIAGSIFTVISVAIYFYWSDRNLVHILARSYEMRPFSLAERAFTQPRVLLFYLSLIFYPIPQRLSLEHDFAVSTSMLNPWTTLPAFLIVGILIGTGLLLVRKQPLVAFAILFFFLNHAIESSIFPLEMVFEHRNYLSSIFIFLPFAAGFIDLKNLLKSRSRNLVLLLQIFPFLIIVLLVAGTYTRNQDWQSEASLWNDTHRKAPGRARPVFNLAKDLERRGRYEQAIILYKNSMSLQPPRRKHFDIMALTNIGTIYFKKKDYDSAIAHYEKALAILPETAKSRYNLAVAYTEIGQFERATDHLDWLIENNPEDRHALNLKGFVLLKQHLLKESLSISRRLLALDSTSRSANLQIGIALTQMGLPDKGAWFLRRAYRAAPGDLMVMLCILENHLERRDKRKANRIMKDIFNRFPIDAIAVILNDSVNEIGNPIRIRKFIREHINEIGRSQPTI